MDGTLKGSTASGQSGPGNNDKSPEVESCHQKLFSVIPRTHLTFWVGILIYLGGYSHLFFWGGYTHLLGGGGILTSVQKIELAYSKSLQLNNRIPEIEVLSVVLSVTI